MGRYTGIPRRCTRAQLKMFGAVSNASYQLKIRAKVRYCVCECFFVADG